MVDQLKQKLDHAIILLATTKEGKVQWIAGTAKDLPQLIDARELAEFAAKSCAGSGNWRVWGRADLAEGIADHPEAVAAVLSSIPGWINNKL